MRPHSALVAWCTLTVANSSPLTSRFLTSAPTVIDTSNNLTFVGNSSFGVESFFNIRFGQDTGGANRFRAPQAFSYAANTIINASSPGAACPQPKVPIPSIPIFQNVTNVSEDCLSLRVDRPRNTTADAKLPVMVFIYGGGYAIGQIYDSSYNPTALVASSAAKKTPVLYVAMNYRIGVFGFASTPAMSPDDLNNGLLDQRLAMEWVQKNIALFGGDPENVTVFGESAGAFSIGLHLVSYGGNSSMALPFSRAVMESGGPTSELGITGNATAVHTAIVMSRANCSLSDYSAELDCLRSVPLDTLLEISVDVADSIDPLGGFNVFTPVVPSTILPSAPSTLLASGRFHRNVSLISGWNEKDGSIFVPTSISNESALESWLAASNLSSAAVGQVLALYPTVDVPDICLSENISPIWFRAEQIDRDRFTACPSLLINSAMANASSDNTSNYLYVLNSTLFASDFAAIGRSYLGVSHFSDIPFVFNHAAAPPFNASESNIELASEVAASWVQFATTGSPSVGTNLTITPWTQGAVTGTGSEYDVRILGGAIGGMATIGHATGSANGNSTMPMYNERLIERCRFWNSLEVLQMNGT